MFHPSLRPRGLCAAAITAAALIQIWSGPIHAETYNLPTGATWNATGSWNPASIPNSIGATAIFNNAASALNPAQTANRSITLDGSQTVGSIVFNNDAANTFTNSIAVGTAGTLVFDEVGAGPATIVTQAAVGTGNNTISGPMTLTDSVVATVNHTAASSAAGSLNLTGTMSGPGGFTKSGDGLATFGTGAKTYTGATILNGGRIRISLAAHPTGTSSFTINAGGQLTPISASTYTFGSGPLILNGSGPTTGPFAAFPGAIRQDTNLGVVINNAVTLQSAALLHVQGSASGVLTFPNVISGGGSLTFTALAHDANLGSLVLNGANTYSGGTIVNGGTLELSGASATLGIGNVLVVSAHAAFAGSSGRILIDPGVLNAIADSATLSLAGGNVAGTADDGFIVLSSGVNETVGSLVLGGVTQAAGTYGSTASAATFKSDEYFSGAGVITVVPEPSAALALIAGFGLLAAKRRRR